MSRQDRCLLKFPDPGAQIGIEEAEAPEIYAVAGTGDHVIGLDPLVGSRAIGQFQFHASIVRFGFVDRGAKMEWHLSGHLLRDEPARRGTEHVAYFFEAEFVGHAAEKQREIGAKKQMPARAQAADRLSKLLQERTQYP